MIPIKPKVGLINLGCPKNQVDSEVMLGALKQQGFSPTEDLEQAEIVIINTCGFIDTAKQESINSIIEYGRLKKVGNCKVLIAAGCLAQRYPDELMKELPELDAVVGTGDISRIAEISGQLMRKRPRLKQREENQFVTLPPYLYNADTPRIHLSPKHWAYIKISEGCNYRCSFCAIPSFRGDLVSRPEGDILSEVRRLADEGVREVNLIAQSLTSYGWEHPALLDLAGRRDRGALIRLLEKIVAVGGVRWLRLYYTYPTDITDALLDLMASEPKICNYVDIPLQHINDGILQKMNRKGDSRLIRHLLSRIRKRVPDVAIRTTFIVGFPGESQEAFDELYRFVQEMGFDRIGVFTYSHEDGTKAFSIEDNVSEAVKTERQTALLNLQSEISLAKHQARVGSVQMVLVDGVSSESGQLEGRLEGQAPEIDGVVLLEGEAKPGEFVKVEIVDATDSDLVGKILVAKLTVSPHR